MLISDEPAPLRGIPKGSNAWNQHHLRFNIRLTCLRKRPP